MDGDRFDALTRAFGAGRTRRGVIKGIGAAALAAAGLGRLDRAAAAKGGASACAHFCQTVFPPGPARGHCVSDAAHGTGPCPACGANPANFCGGSCTSVSTDPNNCGACGNACATSVAHANATCVNGACGFACAAGFSLCDGACVDERSDLGNCGSCGTVCETGVAHANATCLDGVCGFACVDGFTRCGDVCVDESSDLENCGACGNACVTGVADANPICLNGGCGFACVVGFTLCDGACVDERNDPNNCGACGAVCVSGQCANGACVSPSGSGGCPAGANVCEEGITPATTCHGSCYCFATTSGDTVCAAGGDCFPCEVDADCDAQTGPGSFCVLDGGSWCGCGTVGNCQAPCPT